MLGFYDKLQKQKKEYLDLVIRESRKYKNVVIYGAGRVAKPIVHELEEKQIEIYCFAVSDIKVNEEMFYGIPVRQIDEIQLEDSETLFIIAVKQVWADEVVEKIKGKGYTHYIFPPLEVDYFAREVSDQVLRPVMEITVKAGCHVNCRYCPQELFLKSYYVKEQRDEYLTFENYKKCLSKLPPGVIIDFCGFAEPFLNPETIDMIEYTHKQGYDMRLFTTLVGLCKEDLFRIWNIPFLYVVLHTPDEQGYANIPVTDEYLEIFDLILEHYKPNGDRFIDTANCQGIPHREIVKHSQGKMRIMSQLYDRAGNIKDKEVFEEIAWIPDEIYCTRVNKQLDYNVMLPDGTVVLCNYDFGMKHVLGNLLEDSYEEIINGENMRRIVKALDDDKCDLLCRKCNFAFANTAFKCNNDE